MNNNNNNNNKHHHHDNNKDDEADDNDDDVKQQQQQQQPKRTTTSSVIIGNNNNNNNNKLPFKKIVLCFLILSSLMFQFSNLWNNFCSLSDAAVDMEQVSFGGGGGKNGLVSVPPPNREENYVLAFHDSFGFFDDITNEHWERRRTYARNKKMYNKGHPYFWEPQYQHFWYQENMEPYFICPFHERVGGLGDGAKWTCDPYRIARVVQDRKKLWMANHNNNNENNSEEPSHCLVYSIGSNGQYQWEDGIYDLLGPICEIHIFDFSGNFDRPENANKNMHFHQVGLQGSNENRPPDKGGVFRSFPQILNDLGHKNRTIDLFKIDCEECEWTTYTDWIDHDIRQILIETHFLPADISKGEAFFDSFRTHNFIMYSKEINSFCGGKCVEFSFIKLHRNFLNLTSTSSSS